MRGTVNRSMDVRDAGASKKETHCKVEIVKVVAQQLFPDASTADSTGGKNPPQPLCNKW